MLQEIPQMCDMGRAAGLWFFSAEHERVEPIPD